MTAKVPRQASKAMAARRLATMTAHLRLTITMAHHHRQGVIMVRLLKNQVIRSIQGSKTELLKHTGFGGF